MSDILMVDLTPVEFPSPFISGYIIMTDHGNFISVEQGPASRSNVIVRKLFENGYGEGNELHLFVTHIHLDHAGGLGHIMDAVPNSTAYLHPRGIKHVVDPTKLWSAARKALGPVADMYGEPKPCPASRVTYVEDGGSVEVDGEVFRVIYTDGHAPHHQSIFWANEKAMFVGDAAGLHIIEYNYTIPTSVHPFNYKKYLEGLDKMIKYRPEKLMYPHYGVDEGGVDTLIRHKEIVVEWFETVKGNLDKDIPDIIRELRRADPTFDKIYAELKDNIVVSQLVKISVLGMLKEAQRLANE